MSFRAGLRPGDGLLQIGSVPTHGMSHAAAKMEIIRAGNDVDFIIQRSEESLQYHAVYSCSHYVSGM